MKKLISLLATLGLGSTGVSTVVSCSGNTSSTSDTSNNTNAKNLSFVDAKADAGVTDLSVTISQDDASLLGLTSTNNQDTVKGLFSVKDSAGKDVSTVSISVTYNENGSSVKFSINSAVSQETTYTVSIAETDTYNACSFNITFEPTDTPAPEKENLSFESNYHATGTRITVTISQEDTSLLGLTSDSQESDVVALFKVDNNITMKASNNDDNWSVVFTLKNTQAEKEYIVSIDETDTYNACSFTITFNSSNQENSK